MNEKDTQMETYLVRSKEDWLEMTDEEEWKKEHTKAHKVLKMECEEKWKLGSGNRYADGKLIGVK